MADDDNPFESDVAFDDVNLLGAEQASSSSGGVGVATTSFSADASALSGSIGGGTAGRDARGAPGAGPPLADASAPTSWWGRLLACGPLSTNFYRPYFNVDTADVRLRLRSVATPWKAEFFGALDARPDLYGPFWICATLIFLIAATSNLSAWLESDATADQPWEHDFKVLGLGTSLVYGFAIAMPLVAWGSFTYLGFSVASMSLAELASLYGYSLTTFLLACVLCVIPSVAVEWIAVLAALFWSSAFLLRNLWARLGQANDVAGSDGYLPPMAAGADEAGAGAGAALPAQEGDESSPLYLVQPAHRKRTMGLLAGLLSLHVAFAMVLKFKFFGKSF